MAFKMTSDEKRAIGGHEDSLFERMKKKAYDKGYLSGTRGLPVHKSDWEPDFQSDYLRGYEDGRRDQ